LRSSLVLEASRQRAWYPGMVVREESSSIEELKREARGLGVPSRSRALDAENPVGKQMGKKVWIHRQYDDVLPRRGYQAAIDRLPDGFSFNVVRYDMGTGSFAFFDSPDFDGVPEPEVGESVLVSGSEVKRRSPQADPLIWHHKWLFVRDDYQGFDVAESIRRSIRWKKVVGNDPSLSARIGRKSVWGREVLPKLRGEGSTTRPLNGAGLLGRTL